MKTITRFCTALLLTLLAAACQDENTFGPGYLPDKMGHMMKMDQSDITFQAAGGSQTVHVKAMGPHWKFTGSPEWLTISPSEGSGDQSVTFTAQENTSTSAREATLRFMADERDFSHSKDIKVRQDGATEYRTTAPTTPLIFAATPAAPQTIAVTSNEAWTATVTPAEAVWCSVLPSTATGSATLTVTLTDNASTAARSATITITGKTSGDKTEVTVTQAGQEAILSVSPTSLEFERVPAASQTVAVTCNEGWSATVTPAEAVWCSVSPNTATGNGTLTVTATDNQSFSARTATITVTSTSGKTATVSVSQKGGNIGYEDYDEDETLSPSDIVTFSANGVSFKMILVEHGTFQMGSEDNDADSDEKPVHTVALTNDYYMGETEVTQALWYAVMGQKPTASGSQWSSTYGVGDQRPAYYISWNDCQEFITKLNALTGKTFRMPTEAEWEFAARGGNKSKGYKYAGSNTVDDVAWYNSNSSSSTHDVATKQPNELGLYDMSGNVWEWCSDWYGSYSSAAQTNPTGAASGSYRVNRGGGWDGSAGCCRVSDRSGYTPSLRNGPIGLRLAL